MILTIAQYYVAIETAILFLTRDVGLTSVQAREEVERLFAAPRVPRLRASYLTMSRVGATFAVNRAMRSSIFMSFENALNNATSDAPYAIEA